ncbi:hypothetical protein PsorP6_001765 [Peronosclerospora sorghi]|uniref:Uncharacterized protein n=1 Tax=Peronosclerospora sorghi TaxID=230839 RepID=A0ACC0WU18_9STRA|nr:hypothetical protein PsorP6_001765 [Peronosclerospora sorghi]
MFLYMIKRVHLLTVLAVFLPAQYRADSIPAGTDSSAYAVNTSAQLDVQRDLRAIDKNATEAEDGERGRFPVIGESLASSSSGKRKVGEIVPEAVHVPENLEASHLENNQALIESMEKWIESIEKEGQKIEISEVKAIASLLLDDFHISQKLGRNKLERYKLELMLIGHEIFTQLERRDPQWQTTNRRIRNERGNGRSDVMSIAKLVKSVGAIDKSDWYPSWVTFCRSSHLKFDELYVKILWLKISGQNKLEMEDLAYMAAGSEYFKNVRRVAKLSAAKEKASSVQPVPTRQNEKMVADPGQDKDEIDPTIDDFLDDPKFMAKLLKFAKVKGLTPELVRKRARHDLVADLLKKEAKKKRSE